ncbi:hypothetical protein [Streptomyces sp. MBT62]|uniref:hypothetical protein n=1 Tax=Streptomyces sp. MBT62 TaxID=2800410 RepID=UPI00190D05C2|nr:hypothetical protein [Streptomyces sp. MBT62]MBK3563591.1 hypothetical protein [Streptomyces sp. MBT62]
MPHNGAQQRRTEQRVAVADMRGDLRRLVPADDHLLHVTGLGPLAEGRLGGVQQRPARGRHGVAGVRTSAGGQLVHVQHGVARALVEVSAASLNGRLSHARTLRGPTDNARRPATIRFSGPESTIKFDKRLC